MTQTLLVVVLFVAAMAALPWLIRRLQQRGSGPFSAASGGVSKVLSAVAVGPQQRVVTVEVGPEHQRTVLVLGVTAQQINCLHVLAPATLPSATPLAAGPSAPAQPSFAGEMASATARMERPSHG